MNFYKKRNPAREEGLREIERVKQLSPNWIYDSRKVMGLYKSLRGNSEFMLEELKDLKLMIETLLDEAKAWKKDKKQRWALKRCNDLENIIKSYPMYTRQLQGYIRPIEWIREELEQM
jgi:hypothetical protein